MTLNHWVVGSIPTRCRLNFNDLRKFLQNLPRAWLGHFSSELRACIGLAGAHRAEAMALVRAAKRQILAGRREVHQGTWLVRPPVSHPSAMSAVRSTFS